jgi:diguanylate cyclase (GGDEF)-like protein
LLEDRHISQQEETGLPPGSLQNELRGEASENWRDTRALTLQKISPNVPSAGSVEGLRELRKYLFVALAFVTVGAVLAMIDEKWHAPHLTAAVALLMIGVVVTSLFAVYRTRRTVEGFARTVSPSMRDSVTGLPDQEYFRLRLRDEFKRMQRYNTRLSLAVFDVNNLASVNEAYGEAAGDAVLKHIAGLLELTKRASDVAARLGDDEFSLILLECSEEDASKFLRRLERYVTRKPVSVNVDGQSITLWVGVCSGVVSAQEGDTNPLDLLAQARRSLEIAKEDRDRRRERWTNASG